MATAEIVELRDRADVRFVLRSRGCVQVGPEDGARMGTALHELEAP